MPPLSNGLALLEAHRGRQVAATGVREVALEVHTAGSVPINYSIIHAWKLDRGRCKSLLCLTSPRLMAGSKVLIFESPGSAEIEIWLRLRTSRSAIRVAASHERDFVLGTDFTYEDLRFWLPVDDYDVVDTAAPAKNEAGVRRLRVRRRSLRSAGSMDIELDAERYYARRISWLEYNGGAVEKVLDTGLHVPVDGVWGPERISVTRPAAGYASHMVLINVVYGVQLEDGLFLPANLGDIDMPSLQQCMA